MPAYINELLRVDGATGARSRVGLLPDASRALIATSEGTVLGVTIERHGYGVPILPKIQGTLVGRDGTTLVEDVHLAGGAFDEVTDVSGVVWTGSRYLVAIGGVVVTVTADGVSSACLPERVKACPLVGRSGGALMVCGPVEEGAAAYLGVYRIDDAHGVQDPEPIWLGSVTSPWDAAFDGRRWILVGTDGTSLLVHLVGLDGSSTSAPIVVATSDLALGPPKIACREGSHECVVTYAASNGQWTRPMARTLSIDEGLEVGLRPGPTPREGGAASLEWCTAAPSSTGGRGCDCVVSASGRAAGAGGGAGVGLALVLVAVGRRRRRRR